MDEQPKRRGRPPKVRAEPVAETQQEFAGPQRGHILSRNFRFTPKKKATVYPVPFGYRPKPKPSRPRLYPNRI